jgi:hypothetical protein
LRAIAPFPEGATAPARGDDPVVNGSGSRLSPAVHKRIEHRGSARSACLRWPFTSAGRVHLATEEIVGVHLKGSNIDRVRLKSGQVMMRALMIKAMERGTVFMTKPAGLGLQPLQVQLVKKTGKDVITTNPREPDDFLEGVPTL